MKGRTAFRLRRWQGRHWISSWIARSTQLLHCRVFPNQLMRVVP
jgi:hypothetical protein